MDLIVPPELEELILCSCCHLPFNDTDSIPKLFSCRHYFCLKCVNSILLKGTELYCLHCWKRTELQSSANDSTKSIDNLPTYNAILYLSKNFKNMLNSKVKPPDKQSSNNSANNNNNNNNNINNSNSSGSNALVNGPVKLMKKGENCLTHAMPYTLWCTKCVTLVCRACAGSEEHRNHSVKPQNEAKDNIHTDINNELISMQKTLNDVQHLVLKQRDFLLKILESCTSLKTQIETELINHLPTMEIADMRESLAKAKLCLDMLEQQSPNDAIKLLATLNLEKQRLQTKYQEMYLQCKLDDLIRNYAVLFDFDLIKQALTQLHANSLTGLGNDIYNLANNSGHYNPILLLANYCISQLYSRHVLTNKHQQLANNGNYHHQQQQQQHQQQQQQLHHGHHTHHQQQQIPPQQHLSPHDSLVTTVKTYADITTSSPKTNHIHTHQHLSHSSHHQAVASNTNPNAGVIGVNRPSAGVIGSGLNSSNSSSLAPTAPIPGVSYVPADLNGISVPALTMMQHHLQQHSNQQKLSSCSSSTSIGSSTSVVATTANLLTNPSVHVYPIYYFNIEMNGQPCGRILIEVRNDVAPKMSKNFGALAMGELGFGYKGCQIFQCWENESIITGDFELNNGRGGRSVFEEGFFMPDDTKILAIRGSVGMRRSQKRHDNLGLVGSQFRIILREMRGFTGIFAFVIDGLDLVEKISQAGDSAGKPQSNVVIVNCVSVEQEDCPLKTEDEWSPKLYLYQN